MAQGTGSTVVNTKQRLLALCLLLVPGLLWGWAFWQEKTERPLITLYTIDRAPVLSLSFDRTGKTLLSSSVGTGPRQGTRGGAQLFFDLNLPDSELRTVPTGAFGRTPYRRQRALRVYRGNPSAHGPARFAPDAKQFATVTGDSLTVWKTKSGKATRTIKGARPVLAWMPDSKAVCWQSDTGDLLVQEMETGKLRAVYPSPLSGKLREIAVSPNGRRIVCVGEEGESAVLDGESDEIFQIPKHVSLVAFAPNAPARLIFGFDSALWQADLTDKIPSVTPSTAIIGDLVAIAVHPNGKTLAIATRTDDVRLMTIGEKEQRKFLHLREGVTTLAFSPDGKTLATGLKDGRILLWKLP